MNEKKINYDWFTSLNNTILGFKKAYLNNKTHRQIDVERLTHRTQW